MRRRFGRGRRRGSAGDAKGGAIDAPAMMQRIAASGLAGVEALEPVALEGVPEDFAALGVGEDVVVGYSPHGGGEALLAVLALAASREGFAGTACAIAPSWSTAARRWLGLVTPRPYALRSLAAPQLQEGQAEVEALAPADPLPVAPSRVGRLLSRGEDRDLFQRALAGFEGLAAKHGGAVRGVGQRVELVLLARRVASLEVSGGRVRLEVREPDRFGQDLDGESLATALDRLEGALRKRLNDRRVRGGEEGTRAALLRVMERAAALRGARAWPLPSRGAEEIDLLGVDAEGRAVVAVARERLDLGALSRALEAALDPRAKLPLLWGDPELPLREDTPRLLLAANQIDPAALAALGALDLSWEAYDIVTRRTGDLMLERREAREPQTPAARPAPREERPPIERAPREERAAPERAPREERAAAERAPREVRPAFERALREPDAAPERTAPTSPFGEAAPAAGAAASRSGGSRFEEVSLFDLDEDTTREGSDGARRRRRGRRRGRRGRSSEGGEPADETGASRDSGAEVSGEPSPDEGDGRRSRRRRSRPEVGPAAPLPEPTRSPDALDDALDEDERLAPLAEDVPEPEVPDLSYEDEETGDEGEGEGEQDRARHERELRRRARLAKTVEGPPAPPPRPPRRRAAFVAHADRISVLTAVLLARDVRLVEGFWVYPQQELMTFFRSVATDLRDETPIFLIGFTASPPARDTFQAASLYRGRLDWFDHHDWPPEDVVGLGAAIGEAAVHIDPGSESSLSAVIAERTRRSRFSDKLVELATGRFTLHDYERWGRLWWHRLGEIAKRPGERRAELDPLLAGRPSDLAKAAARFEPPPPPIEVAFVSERDFRLVHFGGFVMVVLDVPPGLDPHLTARVARERYAAQLSLTRVEGGDLLILAGDESRSRRGLDLGSMAQHLASKHEWVTALRDDDHVARVRILDLAAYPDRLDEVISEIAMGRSIVEG
jgi:hypothetical protein